MIFEFSDAYDQCKLAVYMHMAVTREPIKESQDPLAALYHTIGNTITTYSMLQLSGLHILDIAAKHIQKTASTSSDRLIRLPSGLLIDFAGQQRPLILRQTDHWVLLHLDTLLAPKPYLLPEEVGKLEWSDTPEKVHIAKARLTFYESSANTDHEGAKGRKPDLALLRLFLWSKDHDVCTRAFKWCPNMAPISESGTEGDANSTSVFIPESMGYEWVEHFIHVLCKVGYRKRAMSWTFLISDIVPKWSILPSSWCCNFASAFLFSIVRPPDMHGILAYQYLAEAYVDMPLEERQAFLSFLSTLLKLVKSSLTWVSLTSLENWLAQLPASLENQEVHTKMKQTLATRKPQLTLELFATELPMVVTVTSL
jgi:hypothetical protein